MNNVQLIFFIAVFLIISSSVSSKMRVYKHIDGNGIIHYSSKKPAGKSYKILHIKCPECRAWRSTVNWNTTPLIVDKFTEEINQASKKWGVEKSVIMAIIHAESAFKKQANSSAGAQGLMQLMPKTQLTYNVKNPFDPAQNIDAGVAYFKHLMKRYNDIDISLAAYNSGETAVEKYGKTIPPFEETQEYVRRVKILMRRYRKI